MMRVNDWSTIRSGATMTVAGRSDGQPVKLTGVEEVAVRDCEVVAVRGGKPIARLVV